MLRIRKSWNRSGTKVGTDTLQQRRFIGSIFIKDMETQREELGCVEAQVANEPSSSNNSSRKRPLEHILSTAHAESIDANRDVKRRRIVNHTSIFATEHHQYDSTCNEDGVKKKTIADYIER
uniref:Uncharacterized protein n=1 Tax=Tanacetum cinerariifolium TaxID=118510 RepID=A0A699L7X7_TANCI|nr:hypothetical protein [Tanacetum cinerariifolium]